MGRTAGVDELLREAEKAGLLVERRGLKWKVTNPESGGSHFIPVQATSRALLNYRARVRQLVTETAGSETRA